MILCLIRFLLNSWLNIFLRSWIPVCAMERIINFALLVCYISRLVIATIELDQKHQSMYPYCGKLYGGWKALICSVNCLPAAVSTHGQFHQVCMGVWMSSPLTLIKMTKCALSLSAAAEWSVIMLVITPWVIPVPRARSSKDMVTFH